MARLQALAKAARRERVSGQFIEALRKSHSVAISIGLVVVLCEHHSIRPIKFSCGQAGAATPMSIDSTVNRLSIHSEKTSNIFP
jgi:hypothetical protein